MTSLPLPIRGSQSIPALPVSQPHQAAGRVHLGLSIADLRWLLSPKALGIIWQPAPFSLPNPLQGQQILADNYAGANGLIALAGHAPWQHATEITAHGFDWLDDLASLGNRPARDLAQAWLALWIRDHDRPFARQGKAWTLEAISARQISLLTHAHFLMAGQNTADRKAMFKLLARQTAWLRHEVTRCPDPVARLHGATAWVFSTASLMGMEGVRPKAIQCLEKAAAQLSTAPETDLPRNPARLASALADLVWMRAVLGRAATPQAVQQAITRLSDCVSVLRPPHGALARFHGCDGGAPALLSQIQDRADEGRKPAALPRFSRAAGYIRLSCAASCLILDASPPPLRREGDLAHASTNAMEFSVNRFAFITSCGTGAGFGPDWMRAGRATQSHSTACLAGRSSAGLDGATLIGGATKVAQSSKPTHGAERVAVSHNAWQADWGLHHIRALTLSHDGMRLEGEDAFAPRNEEDRAIFAARMAQTPRGSLGFSLHFHVHPTVTAQSDMGGRAASFLLPDGQVWVLRPSEGAELVLRPSVYFDPDHRNPRATQQVVLFSTLADYGGAIGWCFLRAQ